MSALGSPDSLLLSSSGGYEIERSLRFNDDDSAYLSRTPSSAGNRKTFTFSCWLKRSELKASTFYTFFSAGPLANTMSFRDGFGVDDALELSANNSIVLRTAALFRDPSAWYHIVYSVDTTQATAANRAKIYVNGVEQSYAYSNYPAQNTDLGFNNNVAHSIGRRQDTSANYFSGYLTEVNFIDGSALDHTSFGETDTETGAWIPKKYGGSYGTNGFYLSFSDNSSVSALGTDTSGRGNNWTPNNFSVTAGAGNDSLEDTPTNNWCTFNSILGDSLNLTSDGNLRIGGTANNYAVGTIAFPSSGKYYAEATLTTYSSGQVQIGICPTGAGANLGGDATAYLQNGATTKNGAASTTLAAYTQGDIIGIAVDVDNSTVQFYKNNAAQTALTGVLRITSASFFSYLSVSSSVVNFNFGQRAFAYTPPAGYKALNTANLPEPTLKNGSAYFTPVLYTGNGTSQSIPVADSQGNSWAPDLVWIKGRSFVSNHRLSDKVRGVNRSLKTNATSAEDTTSTYYVSAFNSNGFSLNSGAGDVNQSGDTFVAWNWLAGGSSSSNTDGSITSTVSANVDAGFSIVGWSSPSSGSTTVGHGLGVAPAVVIAKLRNITTHWRIWHQGLSGGNYTLFFNTGSEQVQNDAFGSAPTSTVLHIGSDFSGSGRTNIAYCFAEVEGYSKFGSYTGNALSGDSGPFVFLGFRPKWVLIKSSTVATSWYLMDDTRGSIQTNTSDANVLFPDTAAAEDANAGQGIDFLSNGFKVRAANGYGLNNSSTYIYMAFAETPFKYANAR